MRDRSFLPFVCMVVLCAVACTTTTAPGVAELAASGAPPVEQGRVLYTHSCSRCHALFMPTSFFPDEWPYYVRKYGRKARLNQAQRDLVLLYLQSASAGTVSREQ